MELLGVLLLAGVPRVCSLLAALPTWSLLKEQKGDQPEKADYHDLPGLLLSAPQCIFNIFQNLREEGLSLFYRGEPPGPEGLSNLLTVSQPVGAEPDFRPTLV